MLAARDNNSDLASRALECSLTSLDSVDERGWTALMEASARGHAQVVQVLCDASADLDTADPDGSTALTLAANEELRLLLEASVEKKRRFLDAILGKEKTKEDTRRDMEKLLAMAKTSGGGSECPF